MCLVFLCVVQTDVFIAMELMGTCAEKLKKRIQGPIPERILGKMTVAVSEATRIHTHTHTRQRLTLLTSSVFVSAPDREGVVVPERETRCHPPGCQTLQHPPGR